MDFDINSMSNMYTDYITKSAGNSSQDKIAASNKDYSKASDAELMDACKKFEAYFLEQCFKEMLKTTGKDEFSSSSTSTLVDYYKDAFVQKISEESTETQSLGLAQMLFEQMKRNYDI